MKRKFEAGKRFGRLVVVERLIGKGRSLCRCDCGTERIIYDGNLVAGRTKSCGCLATESRRASYTHGHATGGKTRTYTIWKGIKQRCLNPGATVWDYYGGRGIRVCERWMRFENFLADMGEAPDDRSIDRINTDGDYEPSNCRWATAVEQRANRRDTAAS